jgi:hypothetical protein
MKKSDLHYFRENRLKPLKKQGIIGLPFRPIAHHATTQRIQLKKNDLHERQFIIRLG